MTSKSRAISPEVPLYQRDPEAWQAALAEGNRNQPRKRVVAELLYRDSAGRILLVDRPDLPDWDLPGGMAGENESPIETASRRARTELGLDFAGGRLLVLDWLRPHGPWDDSIHFVFDGGVLGAEQQTKIDIRDGGLNAARFCDPNEAGRVLRSYVWRRVQHGLATAGAGSSLYLHNGRLPGAN